MLGDKGFSVMIGVLIGVMVVAALGAAAYSALTRFRAEGEAPPALAFVGSRTACGANLTVAAAQKGVRWNEITMRVDGATTYDLSAPGRSVENATWEGRSINTSRSLLAGDKVDITVNTSLGDPVLIVLHEQDTTTLAARVPLRALPQEEACPAAASSDADPPAAAPTPGVFDPGFAYEDPNNDFLFTLGIDIPIPNATIRSGTYAAAPNNGLVIPPSVGAISVGDKIDYRATGRGFVTIAVDLRSGSTAMLRAGQDVRILNTSVRSTDETVDVTGGRGIYANGATILAKKTVNLFAPNDLQLNATRLTSTEETINARATLGGAVYAIDATATARKTIAMGGEGAATHGPILAQRAHLTSTLETINFIASGSGSDVHLEGASIVAANAINIEGSSIYVDGATIDDANNVGRAAPSGVTVVGTPAFGRVSASG